MVITELSNNETQIRILRYEPLISWYKSPTRDLDPYSGTITFYSSKGEKLGKINLINGENYDQKKQIKGWTTTCSYEMVGYWCYGGNYGTPAVCTYEFEERCTSAYNQSFDDGLGSGGGSTEPETTEPSGGGGGTTTTPIPDEEEESEEVLSVDRDSSFVEIDKINCTYEQLIKSGSLEEILKDFFGEDAVFNINFSVVQDLECKGKTTVTGCATQLDDYNYQAKLDKDYVLSEKTPTIFLAQSIIHESIHANLYAAVVKLNKGVVPIDNSFEALFDAYGEKKGWQHEMMADHYRGIMEKAIREVHPHLNDDTRFLNLYDGSGWDKFYEYISYRGLKDTEAGKVYFADTENASLYKEDAETFSTKQPVCDDLEPELELPGPINDGGGEGLPG